MRRLLSILLVTGCAMTGLPGASSAQSNRGFTIFGGPERGYELDYHLERGRADVSDRYRLRIPGRKLAGAISKLTIDYPDYYRGRFDPRQVQVLVGQEKVALTCTENTVEESQTGAIGQPQGQNTSPCKVLWDAQKRAIEVYFPQPLTGSKDLELVLSNVRNPWRGGMFYFNCRISSVTGSPVPQYVGTWVLTID
ncbi:MAG: DUF2808 domain-containing protein [Oscillatoriaceae cyanobacterium]